ncbi:MAG: DivIVA domain-containing protein [Deltaproteobacteria bacterium]|nr:DivIVA domain-containing protein [Deltaproteobacteria bacterium]
MRLTPLDIQNHHFAQRLRGLDPEEVQAFHRLVAEDFEDLIREGERLRERIRELEARVEEMGSREELLRQTLLTAQSVSEDLRRTAAKEAEVVLAEAEVRAEKLLDAAHRRVAKLAEDIREMRTLRTRLGASVRAAIETHVAILDGLVEELPDDPILDGKVAFLAQATKAPGRRSGGPGGAAGPASGAQEA